MKLEKAASGEIEVEPATDDQLDAPYGNPDIRTDPKRWVGISCVGKKFSECPIPFLREYIDLKHWQLRKEAQDGQANGKKSGYLKKDIALALGWIRRIEAGWKAPTFINPDPNMSFADEDDDLRF